MQVKKQRRLFRQRVPNLCQPGLKFDNFKDGCPTFFSRISNSLKLLEQPITRNINRSAHNYTQVGFPLRNKDLPHSRVEQLAKPRQRSYSNPQNLNKKSVRGGGMTLLQLKRRIQFNKMLEEPEILASDFPHTTLEQILAFKQKQQLNQVHIEYEHDKSSDQERSPSRAQKQTRKEDFRPDADVNVWLEKIIGGEGRLYDVYEREMLDKVRAQRRAREKIAHKSMWK